MSDKKKYQDALPGVGCSVINCKYHDTSGICMADSIKVESVASNSKTDTFCSTFTDR